jgi:hypothetical protein
MMPNANQEKRCVDDAKAVACASCSSYEAIEDHPLDKSLGLRDLDTEAMEFAL